jgi:hypothetical protein
MEPDDLYALPFDRFVPERAALAKALRADKRRDEAAEVAALRKPSVAAWAVNQLVRTRGPAIEGLFEAGDALRGAQADLLAGRGDGRTLRAAAEREREAVGRLLADAGGLLSSEAAKFSGSVVERIADTLHAAALDEDAREQVRGGRLERELRHVGLGLGESPGAAPAPAARRARPAAGNARADAGRAARPVDGEDSAAARRGARPAGDEAGAPAKAVPRANVRAGGRAAGGAPRAKRGAEERAAERERVAAERAEQQRLEREREQARKAARAAETAARHRAARAARAVRNAEERRERAARALADADDALAAAREEAEAAAREHQRAQADHGGR